MRLQVVERSIPPSRRRINFPGEHVGGHHEQVHKVFTVYGAIKLVRE
jgi:hypothetical protein